MRLLIIFCFVSFSFFSYAQQSPTKNDEASLEVLGNCGIVKNELKLHSL